MRPSNLLLSSLAALLLPLTVAAQTTAYHDPKGRFDLQIPAGWQASPDDSLDQATFRNGAASLTVMVMKQNDSNAYQPKDAVADTENEYAGQCPTFRVRKRGDVTLAGTPGVYSLFTCSDPHSPAVAEVDAALASGPTVIVLTGIAPLARYHDSLPALDAMRDSLRLTGHPWAAPTYAKKSLAMIELEKACTVGEFPQEDCARQTGILLGKESTAPPQRIPAANLYHDPSGRFFCEIPATWRAIPEGDNGIRGVQLRSGDDWINIMPADAAASASEVVLQYEKSVAERSHLTRTMPFGSIGLIQIFGNGHELTYDSFSGSNPQGTPVESYVGGVGDISGKGDQHLLVVGSFSGEHIAKAGVTFLTAANSLQLGSH